MTGEEFRNARQVFSAVIGRRLSQADMAQIIGLADPAGNGKDTVRKWEDGDGPSGPVSVLVDLLLEGLTAGQSLGISEADVIRYWFADFARCRLG